MTLFITSSLRFEMTVRKQSCTMKSSVIVIFLCQSLASCYRLAGPHRSICTERYYDYFKKNKDGEKKDVSRLWKNIIFPGIYYEYADTKEPIKTVKVEVPGSDPKSKRTVKSTPETPSNAAGTYNVVDARAVPVYDANGIPTRRMKPIQKPQNFVPPQPKPMMISTSENSISVLPNITTSRKQRTPLILYDDVKNGDCAIVRKACSMLDLTVEIRPCAGARYGFSDQMSTVTLGRRDVPFLIDNNPSMYRPRLFGAAAIVEHLFSTYGPGVEKIPKALKLSSGASEAKAPLWAGLFADKSTTQLRPNARLDCNVNIKPVTLYGWEGARFVTPVQRVLCELSVPCLLVNCAPGSANRQQLVTRTGGTFQVPYLVDPNTGTDLFESAAIVKYLEEVYTV